MRSFITIFMLRGSAGSAGDFLHVIRDGRFVSAVQVALTQDIDHSSLSSHLIPTCSKLSL